MIRLTLTVAITLGATSTAAAKEDVYGPPPAWDRYRELAEPAVRAKLPDPSRWQIEWPNGYIASGWKHKGRFPGYLTCGVLRSKVAEAGRARVVNFVAVVDFDKVATVDISSRESNSLVNVHCDGLVSRGHLPPAKLMPQTEVLTLDRLGMSLRAMPEGAYVVSVTPESPAARAGIVPGAVATSINGAVLAGLGTAMLKVFSSEVPQLAVQTAAGTTHSIVVAP